MTSAVQRKYQSHQEDQRSVGCSDSCQFHLVMRRTVQFHIYGRREAIYDGAWDDYPFLRHSERLITSHNKEAITRNDANQFFKVLLRPKNNSSFSLDFL